MPRLDENLKTVVTIDSTTGEQVFTYFYKRKRCPTKLISGHLSKQYVGYYLIMKDLEDTKVWLKQAYDLIPKKKRRGEGLKYGYCLDQIGDKKNHMIVKSLFFSSLIFYGKCFTQAKGRGIKLDKKAIVPKDYHEKHDLIMEYRHTLAAHSGEDPWDTGKVRLLLPPQKGRNVGIHINPELHRLDFEDDSGSDYQFMELVNAVHKAVKIKSEKIGQKIINEIIIPKGRDFWYQTSKTG